jgi:hypothetical protein
MQNSPGILLAALVVAIGLATATILSLLAGVGGDPPLNELQIGAAAWALTLGMFGVQGIVSIVVEGRQVFLGTIEPRLNTPLSAATAALSVLLLVLAGLTGIGHCLRPANARHRCGRGRRLPRPGTPVAVLQGGLHWP